MYRDYKGYNAIIMVKTAYAVECGCITIVKAVPNFLIIEMVY